MNKVRNIFRSVKNWASTRLRSRSLLGATTNFLKHFKYTSSDLKKILPVILVFSVFGYIGPFSPRSASAAQGDILAVRIVGSSNYNGWVAEIDIDSLSTGGTYDMGITTSTPGNTIDANAKVKLNVTSPGYDTNGNATTISRTVYGTNPLRQPYPNQASSDETAGSGFVTIRVALSEFIYAGDTVTADIGDGLYTQSGIANTADTGVSVTNNSTNNYPKPVGRWAWAPYERVNSDFLLETTVFHRFGREGKPLATVKFTCSDEHSNSVSQFASDMTVSTREDSANTGNKVLVYATTMPIASFTQGDVLSCNFTAYPWVGNSNATLNSDLVANGGDGFAQPDERLGPFEVLNDKDGTYGAPCAVVASTGQASNAATWVYSSCAAAEAAYAGDNSLAYADIGRAAQAIRAYNNTNHGHNDPGGGTIELQDQNYTTPGTAPSSLMGTQKTWLTIKPASNIPCQTPVINANSNNDLAAEKLKYSCISTSTTSGNTFKGGTSYTDTLWLDQMKINSTEGAPIRYWKTLYATRNTIDALNRGFRGIYGAARWPASLIRGNYYTPLNTATGAPLDSSLQTVIGNKNIRVDATYADEAPRQISDNAIYAFNSIINSNNGTPEISISGDASTEFTKGIAIVQNVIEAAQSSQPVVAIENMGGTDSINNLVYWHNTIRGQRSNVAYASDGDHCTEALPFFSNWTWKYNIESNNNRIDEDRSDHGCPADGGRIGNWSMTYMVGGAGNALAAGGGPSWSAPDYLGIFTVGDPANEGFVDDKSSTTYGGAGGGGGDYHLEASSSLLNIIPAGQAVLPYDLDGNARYNNGYGAVGAYERTDMTTADLTAPTITAFVIPETADALTIAITTFTATDNVGVTGYLLTESATAPAHDAAGWSSSAPTEYTFAESGAKTLYAWTKDAANNVSSSAGDLVTIVLPDEGCIE